MATFKPDLVDKAEMDRRILEGISNMNPIEYASLYYRVTGKFTRYNEIEDKWEVYGHASKSKR